MTDMTTPTDPTAALKLARDDLQSPISRGPTWALIERYADAVCEYNTAVRIDVGIDKAGAECLSAEKELRAHLAALAAIDAMPAPSGEPHPLTLLQAGFNNGELLVQWRKKLPGVEPTDRELSAFAVGTEVGWHRARDVEKQDWSRVHHVLAKHGKHPGRTDDHLADVIDRALTAQAAPAPLPLTDAQVKDCLVKAHCFGSVRLTYDRGPYEVTSPTVDAIRLAGVIVAEFCRINGIAAIPAKE